MNKPAATVDWQQVRVALEAGIAALADHATWDVDKLMAYIQMLAKWNNTYNLSAIRDPMDMIHLHLLDSLAVMPILNLEYESATRWLDVGTGGGLPGMVMAICRPDWYLVLLDSAGKKTRFLQQCAASLGLDNVAVINDRAEKTQLTPKVDAIISRAFASIGDMTACTSHLLAPGGKFWAMKGQMPVDELSQVEKAYKVTHSHSLNVPGVEAERCLLALQPI